MANPALRPRFLAPGDKLGKFDLIRQIAVGGMAELYLARTMGIEGFEKLVVVKRILPQYVDNPTFVNMFLNEARLSATLHHPNITQVYDIGVEEGDYFFSMEYVHGEDLGRLVSSANENGVPVSLDVALTLMAGLCAGLHYAHEKAGPDGKPLNVVHRDVSPSNVLVSYDGAVKLVDFGIARAGSAPTTTRGGLKGKIAYMSPEQCRGKGTLDRRSDIFSIGTILYELTTGQTPFTADNEYAVLEQIVNNDVPPPSKLVPGYAPALEAIVLRALARDPDQRYATALELQGQLEDFAHENRLRVSPLVLSRLMSNLFPTRLEEWDHARAQGAFFVEQHVVRTLIESGRTGEAVDVPTGKIPTPVPAPPEDETTDVVALRPLDTNVGAAPAPSREAENPFSATDSGIDTLAGPPVAAARMPTPIPHRPTPMPHRPSPMPLPAPRPTPMPNTLQSAADQLTAARTPAPVPGMPGAVPIVGAGTLVSHQAAVEEIDSPAVDVTERVRVPTPLPSRDDTAFVRPVRSRVPLIVGLAVAVAGAAIAIIVIGGSSGSSKPAAAAADPPPAPAPTAAKAAAPDPEMAPEPVEKEAVTPEPAAVPEPAPEPEIAMDPEPAPEPKKRPPVVKSPPVVKAIRKTPVKKTDPAKTETKKEPAWNDESPFMPVRTDGKK